MQVGSVHLCTKFEADSSFRSKVIGGGGKDFEIGSRDTGHTHLGVSLNSLRRRGPPSICVPNLKRNAQFIPKLLRSPEIKKYRSHDPSHPN